MRTQAVLAVMTGLLFFSGGARSETYISAYAGAAFPQSEKVNKNGLAGTQEHDTGPAFGIKTGRWFTENNAPYFGAQLEYNIFKSTWKLRADSDVVWGLPSNSYSEGDFTLTSLTGNILLRMPDWKIRPHAGLGAGWFIRDEDAADIAIFSDTTGAVIGFGRHPASRSTGLGWQALAGVEFDVAASFALFGEYKYSNFESFSVSQVYGGLLYLF